MSVSCIGRVRDDTLDLIRAIVPTVKPQVPWSHIGVEADEMAVGAGTREFTTREMELVDPTETALGGAGQRQQSLRLQLRITYLMEQDVTDMIGGDHVDLCSALQPSSTYQSGSWGSCRVRRVGATVRDDDNDAGIVIVRQTIEHIVRYPVSI